MRIVLALVVLLVLAALVFTVLEFDDADQTVDTAVESSDDAGSDTGDEVGGVAAADSGGDAVSTGAVEVEPVTPSFDIVRVETSGKAVMAGRAAPGATVQIYSYDGLVAESKADERGDWAIVLEEPLEPGSRELWLKSEEASGAVAESRESVAMLVPEPGETPSASVGTVEPSASGDADQTGTFADTAEETIAVLVPRDNDGEVEILQEPEDGVGLAGGDGLSLDTLDYDEAGEVSLSGQTEPGAEVRAYVDGELVGRALADSAGNWRMMPEKAVDQGLHALRIDQVDEAGIVLGRVETPFDRESLQLPESAEPLVIIQPGNNLWTIARHSYGSGFHYTHIYEANQGQIADPHLIYPGQIFVLPTIN